MAQSNFDLAGKAVEQFFKDGGDTSNDNKLALYKFFKQGNVGDCNTDRPGGLNPFSKDKAKWDAWNSAKGLSKEDAQAEYIKLAKSIVPESLANTF